jgi:hypothetical protein
VSVYSIGIALGDIALHLSDRLPGTLNVKRKFGHLTAHPVRLVLTDRSQ